MIITESGDIGIHYGVRDYKLRPSFAAISLLGTSKEIVEWFSIVNEASNELQVIYSVAILTACSQEDISHLVGRFLLMDHGIEFKKGLITDSEIILLAQSLMKHGIIGDVEIKPRGEHGDYSPIFEAKKYVAMAMAHLGLNETDAWNLTMTSFLGALEAKYPNTEAGNMPTLDDVDQTMAWFQDVQAARARNE